MKTFKTLNSILILMCFLAMNAGSVSAQWELSSDLNGPYQAVKPYVAEDDSTVKKDDQLTENEREKIIAMTKNAVQQLDRSESFNVKAQTSNFMEKEISKYNSVGEKLANYRNADVVKGDLVTDGIDSSYGPGITPPVAKYVPKTPVSSPTADILGFLATQNESPLRPVSKTESEKKRLLKNMDIQAQTTEANPTVSANPVAIQVVDSVQFNDKVRMIYELLNPPGDLHPWLKWLLYSNRVTKDMVAFYNDTLKKRDALYQKALTSNGKLAIMYRNRIFKDIPLYVMPEWANGDYSLVSVGLENNLSATVSAQMPVS